MRNYGRNVGQCKVTDMPRSAQGDRAQTNLWRYLSGDTSKSIDAILAPIANLLPPTS